MRILISMLLALSACGKPVQVTYNANGGTATVQTVHNYSLTISGDNCQISATIITPNNGQVIDPPGGGTYTIPVGSSTTISITSTVSGDAQVSQFAPCGQAHAIFYKDGTMVAQQFVSQGGSWDSGAL